MRKDPFTGKQKFHQGTDSLTASENVYAMMPGRIKKIDYDRKLGNYIVLEHGEFVVTYAHLHTVVGRKGDTVKAGQSRSERRYQRKYRTKYWRPSACLHPLPQETD